MLKMCNMEIRAIRMMKKNVQISTKELPKQTTLNTTNIRKAETYHIRAVKPGRGIGECRCVAYYKKKKKSKT